MTDLVTIGRLLAVHGFKGWVKCQIHEGISAIDINPNDWIFLSIQNKPVPFRIEAIQFPSDELWLLKLHWYDSDDTVKELLGHQLLLSKSLVPNPEEQLGLKALAGFKVFNGEFALGILIDVDDRTSQELMVIETIDKQQVLIPFHEDFIEDVSFEDRSLKLNLPDGLLDLGTT